MKTLLDLIEGQVGAYFLIGFFTLAVVSFIIITIYSIYKLVCGKNFTKKSLIFSFGIPVSFFASGTFVLFIRSFLKAFFETPIS